MAIGFFPRTRTRYDAARQANQSPWNWLLRGVATPNQTGDFLGAFQGGLSGALAAKQAAAQSEADQQRQRLQDDLTERMYGLDERRVAADEMRAQQEKIPRSESDLEFYKRDPKGYANFKNTGRAPDQINSELDLFRNNRPSWEELQRAKQSFTDPNQVGYTTHVNKFDEMGRPEDTTSRRLYEGDDESALIDEAFSHGDSAVLQSMAAGNLGDGVKSPHVKTALQQKAQKRLSEMQANHQRQLETHAHDLFQ